MPSLPQTHVTLNAQRGCAAHVATWLSPSCTHCADYFTQDIPKILSMPGLCMDIHFLPNIYKLDRYVAVLIWSQGPEKAMQNAELFYRNQNKWLDPSSSREKLDDPTRAEDIEEFLKALKADPSKDLVRIKAYLDAKDEALYVKMFALRYFPIDHLEKYLPIHSSANDFGADKELSMALINEVPKKDGTLINFSPAFTDMSGQLLPDEQLKHGILTTGMAEEILKNAGPFVAQPVKPVAPLPEKRKALSDYHEYQPKKKKAKIARKAAIDLEGAQEADSLERDEAELFGKDDDGDESTTYDSEEELTADEGETTDDEFENDGYYDNEKHIAKLNDILESLD